MIAVIGIRAGKLALIAQSRAPWIGVERMEGESYGFHAALLRSPDFVPVHLEVRGDIRCEDRASGILAETGRMVDKVTADNTSPDELERRINEACANEHARWRLGRRSG